MNISFNLLVNIVLFVGAGQGVILTWFLFNVKTNQISNRLLGILTFMWSIILTVFALQSYGLYSEFPHLIKTFFVLLFAWFPLLYLSVKYLFSSFKHFKLQDLLHFIPMVLIIFLNIGFYLKSGAEKLELIDNSSGYFYIIDTISEEILSLQGLIYTLLSLRIINKYKENIVNYKSTIDHRVIRGFKTGIVLAFVGWLFGIIGTHLEKFDIELHVDLFLFVYLFFVLIIYMLSILVIRSPEVFKLTNDDVEKLIVTKTEIITEEVNKRKEKAILKEEQDDENLIINQENKRLLQLMDEEKPFLNPDLDLIELSEKMGISRHQLSALINQYQKMNFYEFINHFRVNEAIDLMTNPKNKTLKNYEIAFEAGFNSKATFYRIFKQVTGQTPSDFRSIS